MLYFHFHWHPVLKYLQDLNFKLGIQIYKYNFAIDQKWTLLSYLYQNYQESQQNLGTIFKNKVLQKWR